MTGRHEHADRVDRPWGSYTVLEDAASHKVKRIEVRPGARLSYQRHRLRDEHWFVVTGTGEVIVDGTARRLGAGDAVDIPKGVAHRVANVGDGPFVFVEVQVGEYFGEDDIQRLDDDYGRAGTSGRGPEVAAIELRELRAEEWRSWRSVRRAALAEAPTAFGSSLAEWSGDGDTEERWRARLASVAHNVLAHVDGHAVGMVSATEPSCGDAELLGMWVAPEGRGKGIGDALVAQVKEWAGRSGASRVVLCVRAANSHAIALYARHGFADEGPEPEPGDPLAERRMVALLDVEAGRREVPGR